MFVNECNLQELKKIKFYNLEVNYIKMMQKSKF